MLESDFIIPVSEPSAQSITKTLISNDILRRSVMEAKSQKKRGKLASQFDHEQISRAARMYRTNSDAGRALGIAAGSFTRLCKTYEIESPAERSRRERTERKEVESV